MQLKKIAEANRGITLVEMIVGMLIFVIITMTVVVIMYPTLNSINRTKNLSELGMFADNIAAEISNDIKMANTLEIKEVEGQTDTLTLTTYENKLIYSTVDGRIKKNYDDMEASDGSLLFSDLVSSKYYDNRSVKVSYENIVDSEGISIGCKIIIEIYDNDGELAITREYSVISLILQSN